MALYPRRQKQFGVAPALQERFDVRSQLCRNWPAFTRLGDGAPDLSDR